MKIKTKQKNIYWGLLLMLVAGTEFLDKSIFFVISFIYLLFVIFQNKFKFVIPKIPGFKLYLVMIIYGTVLGCFFYTFRNIARDISYFVPTLIWVLLGANITKNKTDSFNVIYRTLCLFAIIISFTDLVSFIVAQDWTFAGIRDAFVTGIYDIGFIYPIMVLNSVFNNNYAFSRKIDNLILIALTMHIFASIGRISILVPLLNVIIVLIFTLKYKAEQKKHMRKIVTLLCILVVVAILIFVIVPDDITLFFSEKIFGTFEELNSKQIFNSTESAMNNWRGYEMQVALEQWKDSNLFQQIFGAGLGQGVHIDYIPYSWADANMVVNNEIPVLHNGFYTALIKIGVVGMLALIAIFVGTLIKALKIIRKSFNNIDKNIIVIVLSVGGIFYTYVVRGPIEKGPFLVWGLLMGILSTQKLNDFENILQKENVL